MRRIRLLLAAIALVAMPATSALAQSNEGEVIVVHGVPDLAVDVYVNGDLTLEGFEFGDVAGPLTLPAGTYDIEIYGAGADPDTDDPALAGSAELPAGAAATIAAYLQEGGSPTLGVFVENNDTTAAGEGRISAYHLADFGAVDVLVNDSAVWEGVTNGQGANADLPVDTYNVKITAAGDAATVAFDDDVSLSEGTNTIAYAIGSVEGGSFTVATAALDVGADSPDGVPTGDAGLAASNDWLTVALAAAAVVLLTLGVRTLAAERR